MFRAFAGPRREKYRFLDNTFAGICSGWLRRHQLLLPVLAHEKSSCLNLWGALLLYQKSEKSPFYLCGTFIFRPKLYQWVLVLPMGILTFRDENPKSHLHMVISKWCTQTPNFISNFQTHAIVGDNFFSHF